MGFDHSRKMMDKHAMEEYVATDPVIRDRYGKIVKAIPVSNREYQHRYEKLNESREMKTPPSSDRIFSGYLVVRNLGKESEYETWIPDHAFEEVYEKANKKL